MSKPRIPHGSSDSQSAIRILIRLPLSIHQNPQRRKGSISFKLAQDEQIDNSRRILSHFQIGGDSVIRRKTFSTDFFCLFDSSTKKQNGFCSFDIELKVSYSLPVNIRFSSWI
jgi:hypothetical protein